MPAKRKQMELIQCTVDEFYFSVLCDEEEEIFPISDEKYAQALQLQEALVSSAISSGCGRSNPTPTTTPNPTKETGQSSQGYCPICMDVKQGVEMFTNNTCTHSFCTDCIGNYVAAKIHENILNVRCPDLKCKSNLDPQLLRSLLPKEVFDRWENVLCESLVLGSHKFYCPFKDCSAMLLDDENEVVTMSECPICRRLFCAQCKVSWHAGIECEEFQKLGKNDREIEDIMLMELARQKEWRRCPSCNFYVEKISGCLHIICRLMSIIYITYQPLFFYINSYVLGIIIIFFKSILVTK